MWLVCQVPSLHIREVEVTEEIHCRLFRLKESVTGLYRLGIDVTHTRDEAVALAESFRQHYIRTLQERIEELQSIDFTK